jgi:hypothetical protein
LIERVERMVTKRTNGHTLLTGRSGQVRNQISGNRAIRGYRRRKTGDGSDLFGNATSSITRREVIDAKESSTPVAKEKENQCPAFAGKVAAELPHHICAIVAAREGGERWHG